MVLIDAHCHLSELDDVQLDGVLTRARENGVDLLMAIGAGYGVDDNGKTFDIAQTHANVYCSLGIHPHDAKLMTDENFASLKTWMTNDKVRAVGEIGLDYHYMNSTRDEQIKTLRRFVGLAHEIKKPVMIHDRDCGTECVDILREEKADVCGGMVHCFSGSAELALRYLDLGFYVSFSGMITFKKAHELREVVKQVPLDRILVETDAPFLTPEPHRGKTNESAYVKHVAERMAQIRGLSFEEICDITTKNAKRFFGI
jgi:TatD DNase family protein